jgi:transposase
VIDEAGITLMQSIVATQEEALSELLSAQRGELFVVLENGSQSAWLYEVIKPLVTEVTVCNPRENRLLAVGNKADLTDAEKLARLLRLGALKSVFQGAPNQRRLKDLVRAYECVVNDQVRVMNRLKSLYRARGIDSTGAGLYHPNQRESWIERLSEQSTRFRARVLFTELATLQTLRRESRAEMLRQARLDPDYRYLCLIPGIGRISAAYLLAYVGSPHRFRTKRQFWPYCGLSVVTRSSADHILEGGKLIRRTKTTTTRGLNHNYCHQLKSVFKTAAQKTARREPFCHYYERLVRSGTRPALAQVSLARKIAAITLAIWQRRERFDDDRVIAAI